MKGAHLETSEATSVTIVSQQLLTRLDRGDFVMRIAGAGGCWAEDEGPRVPLIQCQVAHCLRSGKTERHDLSFTNEVVHSLRNPCDVFVRVHGTVEGRWFLTPHAFLSRSSLE